MKLVDEKPSKEKRRQLRIDRPMNHDGYCPIIDGRAVGRYVHYETALEHAGRNASNLVVRFADIKKHGYKQGRRRNAISA